MYGYVYLTENLINGKCYIGQHRATEFDKNYKGSGKYIRQAIKKYGWDNFITTIIEWCKTREQLNQREDYWIEKCDAANSNNFYNICYSAYGHSQTEETKEKISKNGHGWSESARQKAHEANRARGDKTRALKQLKKQTSQIGYWKGKHLPDDYKKRISNTLTGRTLPDEQKKKIGAAFKGKSWKIVDGKRVWYDKT